MQRYKKKTYFCKLKKEIISNTMKPTILTLALTLILTMTAVSVKGQNDLLPAPVEGEQTVHHRAYSLSYNPQHNEPSWVCYLLTREHAAGSLKRKDSFKADPLVTDGSATPTDYSRSGYDKGHLAPAADMSWDSTVLDECFFMSNMSPQTHAFNAGLWKRTETMVRDWAIIYDSLWVVTGPVFTVGTIRQCTTFIRCDTGMHCDTITDCITLIETPDSLKTIGKNHQVSVPEYFYKIVYNPRTYQAVALLVPHENKKGSLKNWAVTVDVIEEISGLDFFPELDDELEEQIESNICIPCWDWERNKSR